MRRSVISRVSPAGEAFETRAVEVGGADLDPLAFAFWNVQPEIVVENVARYAEEAGERVRCLVVDGDYEAKVGAWLAAGRGPDLFYAQRAEASRWGARGWIAPLDADDPLLAPTLARMDPRLVEGARNHDGRLLGLTYYNGGPFALFVHERFAGSVRLGELRSLRGILDACRRLARSGACRQPFAPRWHATQTGLVWSVLCHLAAEGVLDLAATQAPAALARVLAFLGALSAEGLVPPDALDDQGDRAAVARWASGRHAFAFTMDYLAIDACEIAGAPAAIVSPDYPEPPLLPGQALLCRRSGLRGDRAARALGLIVHLGGLGRDGEPRVHRRWLAERLFAAPFPELDEDLDVRRSMARAFAPREAEGSVDRLVAARGRAVVSPPTHQPWFLDWSALCDHAVREDVLRRPRRTPEAAAALLLAEWARLARAS